MSATSVASFRNLNLGQARSHSPASPQLLAAFEAARAAGVRSFQTNGGAAGLALPPRSGTDRRAPRGPGARGQRQRQPHTGLATLTLERLLGVPVASRAVSTLERLRARLRP